MIFPTGENQKGEKRHCLLSLKKNTNLQKNDQNNDLSTQHPKQAREEKHGGCPESQTINKGEHQETILEVDPCSLRRSRRRSLQLEKPGERFGGGKERRRGNQ